MAEAQNIPEKQQPQAEKPTAPMDEKTKSVMENFDKSEKEQVENVNKMFEDKLSGSKMGEIALTEVRKLKEDQKTSVRTTFEEFKKMYRERVEQNKSDRDALAKELLDRAQDKVEARLRNIQIILDMLVKGTYITEEEAAALIRTLKGVEQISSQDIETQQILLKLQRHETLGDEDYRRIIPLIRPRILTLKDAKPQENFEATTAGILIGFMTGAQRYRLVQEYMDSSRQGDTADLIDGFLRTGILTVTQGEELFRQAVEKKVISEQDFRDVYQKRIDQGFYVEEVKKVKEAIDKEVERLKGMYSTNMLERVTGTPLIGAGMLLHSFFWILTNFLASGGDFKSLLRNPYMWAAVGEGALGIEVTTGSLKEGAGNFGIGSGWLSRMLERVTEKEGPQNTVQQNAYRIMGEIYLSYPDFGAYLENGGAARIIAIRKAKSAQGKTGQELIITFEELLTSETEKIQKDRLQDAHRKNEKATFAQINGIAEAVTVLKIESQQDFNNKLDFIKKDQGLQSATPSFGDGLAPGGAPLALTS